MEHLADGEIASTCCIRIGKHFVRKLWVRQSFLNGFKLGLDIPIETNEQQTSIDSANVIEVIHEIIPAAQNPFTL